MARTKASVGAKVASGKSSKARCSAAPPPSSTGSGGSSNTSSRASHSGGNSVCPRETPKWQRPITNFFIGKDTSQDSDTQENEHTENAATSSKAKPKRNIIESDDEETPEDKTKNEDLEEMPGNKTKNKVLEETPEDKKKNKVLDETIELEPLIGDDSHKIEEYYPQKGEKGKGRGKKTKKENINGNTEKDQQRKSVKRDFEESVEEPISKRVKVN